MSDSPKAKSKYSAKRWIGCPVEEEFFGSNRKEGKQERKIASDTDRSKYKKSDREKVKVEGLHKNIKLDKEQFLIGRVLAITPEAIEVDSHGEIHFCTLRGLLKKERSEAKNLVTVGDIVWFQSNGLIAHVEPRSSVLSRADNLSRRKEQLIASNIDLLIITGSVVSPMLKPFLLDRYLIAARKGNLKPLIVINKIDLLDDPAQDPVIRETERHILDELLQAYASTDIPVITVSTSTGQGLEALKEAMRDKASVFSGQSGVGKSSLINAITGMDLRVGGIVEKTRKGSHTTTSARLLPLASGGWCVDTPGIKSFGVWELKEDEVVGYFSEIDALGKKCHFANCSHIHETGCAVLEALENEALSLLRYESYRMLMESVATLHRRR
jgi:ribosome biogenesis GTPase